jgi:hypothetical protein
MKQVKGKYIRLTEEHLNKIVKEAVERQLGIMLEYAIPRKDFVDNATNHLGQVLENWCLVHYCTLCGRTETKDHWKNELLTHMMNIGSHTLKNNDSYDSRVKAIYEGFEKKDIPSTPERIRKLIAAKLIVEKINTKDPAVIKSVEDCHNAIEAIIGYIAGGDSEVAWEYIQTI